MKQFIYASLAASAFAAVLPRDSCKNDDCFAAINTNTGICAPYQTRTKYLTTETVYATVTKGLQARDKGRGGKTRTRTRDDHASSSTSSSSISSSTGYFNSTSSEDRPRSSSSDDNGVDITSAIPALPTVTVVPTITTTSDDKGGLVRRAKKTRTKTRDDASSSIFSSILPSVSLASSIDNKTLTAVPASVDDSIGSLITPAPVASPVAAVDDSGHFGKRAADKGRGKDDSSSSSSSSSSASSPAGSSSEDNTSRTSSDDNSPSSTSVEDNTSRASDDNSPSTTGAASTSSDDHGGNRPSSSTSSTATLTAVLPTVSVCRGDSKVRSACSCNGITSTTITLPTGTRTRYVTVTAAV